MADQPYQITGLELASPDDALTKLFEANQARTRAERECDESKTRLRAAKDYQAALLQYIDQYSIARRERLARQEALGKGFAEEPMPPWCVPGTDPDKRAD